MRTRLGSEKRRSKASRTITGMKESITCGILGNIHKPPESRLARTLAQEAELCNHTMRCSDWRVEENASEVRARDYKASNATSHIGCHDQKY